MKIVNIEIEGISPLMHHRMTEEALFGLLGTKQKVLEAEETKTPRNIAEKHAYKDQEGFYIPLEMFVGAFKFAASDYKEKNKSRKSMKGVAAAIFRPAQDKAYLTDEKGKLIKDFEVDVRKATNHLKGAVAVCRPRFDRWKTKFTVQIDDSMITMPMAQSILEDAGKKAGIGSFRVQRGGYFGQFRILSWKEQKEN